MEKAKMQSFKDKARKVFEKCLGKTIEKYDVEKATDELANWFFTHKRDMDMKTFDEILAKSKL